MMKIHCVYDRIVPIGTLIPHPKNRNVHPKEQIERLAKILNYQGWRYPIKVSKRSGFVTSGHGRLSAAKLNQWDEVPVNFQDYDDETQEYADVTSDNAIASWAELDLSGINNDVVDLGPDFDIDLLGIEGFVLDMADKSADWVGMPEFEQEEQQGVQRIAVHFNTHADVAAFAKLIGQVLTPKTRGIWYPEAKIERYADKRYSSEP